MDIISEKPEENKIKNFEKAAENQIAVAMTNFQKGEYQKALKILLNSMDRANSSKILSIIGSCYWHLNDKNNAFLSWNKAIAISNQSPSAEPYIHIAEAYFSENKINEAISNWIIATTFEPENPLLNFNLAKAYSSLNNYIISFKYYEKYLKYEPDKSSLKFQQIQNQIENMKSKGISFLRTALSFSRESRTQKQMLSEYINSINAYPYQVNLCMTISTVYSHLNDYENAIKYLLQAYITSDFSNSPLLSIALAYDNAKIFDYAYCYYHRYLKTLNENSSEYNTICKKILSIKGLATDSEEYVNIHLRNAQKYEKNSNFEYALIEYENYKILSENNSDDLIDKIETIKAVLNPEPIVINSLIKNLDYAFLNKSFENVLQIAQRIMIIAQNLNEKQYNYAKKKLNEAKNRLGL